MVTHHDTMSKGDIIQCVKQYRYAHIVILKIESKTNNGFMVFVKNNNNYFVITYVIRLELADCVHH